MGRKELLYLLLGTINIIGMVFLIIILDSSMTLLVAAAGVFLEMFTTYRVIKIQDSKITKPLNLLDTGIEKYLETGELNIDSDKFPKEYLKVTEQIQRLAQALENFREQDEKIKAGSSTEITTLQRELEVQKQATFTVLREIQEEKEFSQKQAKELEKFQLAVKEASDHIVITDAEGYVLYTNPSGKIITGYTEDEIVHTKAGKVWGDLMDKAYYSEMWKTIKEEKKVFKSEITNKRRDGSTYIAEISISPVLDENKDVLFFVSIQRDITKAKEVDRMKTEFISLASHQLRAPLAAIRWGLESLLDGIAGTLTENQKLYTKDAYDSTTRMVDLVGGLLNVSRIESGRLVVEPVMTDVKALVESVIKEVTVLAKEKNHNISFRAQEGIPQIKLDPKLIRNVYLNFLTNAIKYTPSNGIIEVEIMTDQGNLVSRVKDNGLGIPKKDQEKIFNKFFRADNVRRVDTDGTGLGLYLVKAIIENSEGHVWFESEENKGTTFFFTLPLSGMIHKEGQVSLE